MLVKVLLKAMTMSHIFGAMELLFMGSIRLGDSIWEFSLEGRGGVDGVVKGIRDDTV